ncbi:MAG: hypothetical protein ABJ176_13370, partial [Anderseniella sp.]
MIAGVQILALLALGIFLILLTPVLLARRIAARTGASHLERFCAWLCRIRVALGFLLGLMFGAFLCICFTELTELARGASACVRALFWLLLLALLVAFWLAYRLLACWRVFFTPV